MIEGLTRDPKEVLLDWSVLTETQLLPFSSRGILCKDPAEPSCDSKGKTLDSELTCLGTRGRKPGVTED